MKTLVVDMDDIYIDPANGLNWLFYLKGKYPDFKCNLFVVPGRSTNNWLYMLENLGWVELGIHGNNHDTTEEITEEMISTIWPWLNHKLYKGPDWKVNKKEMDLLLRHGFSLAVKEVIDHPIKQWPLTDPRVLHGHTWVEADWKRVDESIDEETEFQFISEVLYDI